ncbi:MAG: D-alanyl-D-alanine carboxypeptidase [Clostridia bacterium]|nr:D-alanyl-D-alanine carboxypeptidase [Clostridia bacterium]
MKNLCRILIFIWIALLLLPAGAHAEQQDAHSESPDDADEPAFGALTGHDDAWRKEREKAYKSIEKNAKAEGIYVADACDITRGYFARKEHVGIHPASTTKIMTALVILEQCALDEKETAPQEATRLGGSDSLMGLLKNETLTVEELLYGLMLCSGNDAAVTLAFHLSGSEDAFGKVMDDRAKELGMTDTHFTNPSGKNRNGNVSSAYDMTLLTQVALQNETFRTIVSTVSYTIQPNDVRKKAMVMTNRNKLISDPPGKGYYYEYAIGVKTGSTGTGNSLIAAATKEDVTIICSQLGVTGDDFGLRSKELFKRARELFEYVFTYEYDHVTAETMLAGKTLTVAVENARVTDPENGMLALNVGTEDVTVFRPIAEIESLLSGKAEFAVTFDASPTAPISEGQHVANAIFSYGGRVWFTLPVYASRSVEEFVPADLYTPTPAPTPTPPPLSETPTPLAPVTIEGETLTASPAPLTPAPTGAPDAAPVEMRQKNEPNLKTFLWAPIALVLLFGALAGLLIYRRKHK